MFIQVVFKIKCLEILDKGTSLLLDAFKCWIRLHMFIQIVFISKYLVKLDTGKSPKTLVQKNQSKQTNWKVLDAKN